MKHITATFLKGLFTLLPLLLSAYVLIWFLRMVEDFAHYGILFYWPDALYVPGMGVAVMVFIIFGFGVVVDRPLARWAVRAIEKTLSHVPLLKTVYLAIKDFTDFLKPTSKKANQVVVIKFPGVSIEIVGLLTRDNLSDLPDGVSKDDRVAVYIPISYQLGGYTIFVPRSTITPIDLSVEEAMRSIVTAWLPGRAKKLEMQDEDSIS
jgi:uncharacterized membrane protein